MEVDYRLYTWSGYERVQIGTEIFENTKVTCCDEYWVYLIKDNKELFRIDYNGENRQTLHVDESQKIAPFDPTYTHVRDNSVLFFVAAAGSDYGIYRLYLPDMTLDLLHTSEEKPKLYVPYSNFEITWSCQVENAGKNTQEIYYYYNSQTGELLERPVYGGRSWDYSAWAWWKTEPAEVTNPDYRYYCQPPEDIRVNCRGVFGEDVMGPGGIIHTKDHIYYVPEEDHTKLYRVEYSGENKTLLYHSAYGEIGWLDYFGNDPNGVMYMLTGGNRIIALYIATGNVETMMQQYEIISFMYYPDRVRDGGEHLGPTFDWVGRANEGDELSGNLYRIETGENFYYFYL